MPDRSRRLRTRRRSRRIAARSLIAALLLAPSACSEREPATDDAFAASALLSAPRAPKPGFRGSSGFRLTQNTIQLNAQIGTASATDTFVLDSGAPMTIAPRLGRDLGLASLAHVSLAGPEGGGRSVPVTLIPEVRVAGVPFRDVGAVIDWVEPPSELACLSVDGLMGASLLQAAIWQIDFQTRQINVTDRLNDLPGLDGAMRIAFARSDESGSPRIEVGVSDRDDVSLLVDLGFNGSLAIPAALFEESGNRLASDAPTENGEASTTVFGATSSAVRIGRLRELRIGDLRLADFPVVTGDSVSDFHVGIEFLRHFRVTLDWLNDDLYLEPIDPENALYDDFASYGFKPQLRDGQLVVGALWQGSTAERAGLELGDRLVEIDGRSTESPDFAVLCDVLDAIGLFGWNEAPISVVVQRAEERETIRIARAPLLNSPDDSDQDADD